MNTSPRTGIATFFAVLFLMFVLFSPVAMAQTPPTAITNTASGVGPYDATLTGTVNANGNSATVTFQYGLDTGYGRTLTADQNPVSGTTDQAVSITVGELTPNTTYHFRVVASNVGGTTNGNDVTFTTAAAAPTAVSVAATSIGAVGATLNGTINAQNASTTVTFEYGLNTSYGTTVTADQSPVTGIANTAVSRAITGLTAGETYHFRVVGQNAGGTTYGGDMVFTAGIPPTVTTNAASAVGLTSATLNGVINANGSSTVVTFEYGLTTSYNRVIAATTSPVTGSSDTAVNGELTGLLPNTEYHFRVVGQNLSGTTYGGDRMFSTSAAAPVAVTGPASGVTGTGATLNGTVNANNASTTVTFQYGLTISYGTTVTAVQSPVGGVATTAVSRAISGLTADTTYHFRVVGQNATGTTYGDDVTFFTGVSAPTAVTNAATGIGGDNATLNGTVNPYSNSTVVTFEYGESGAYGRSATADQSPISGSSNIAVTSTLTGLIPGTTYHFRVVGQSGTGTGNGVDMTFTTLPVVITDGPSGVTSSAATLLGRANPGNESAVVTFEYGLTIAYGTTVTADQSPVSGNVLRVVSHGISGLQPNSEYHYRVIGQNTGGTNYGFDSSFMTDAITPTVTTHPATSLGTTGATLQGTVNANFASTIVTFQYGLDTSYGNTTTAAQSPVTGGANTPVSSAITGLQPNTTYHFRAVGQNIAGTVYGSDLTFTTAPAPPTVTTNPATGVTLSGATLNGTVNANNQSTTVTFEYGLTATYGTTVTAVPSPVTGGVGMTVTYALTGLLPGTPYHYRVVGQNGTGTSYGNDVLFATRAPEIPTLSDLGLFMLALILGVLALLLFRK